MVILEEIIEEKRQDIVEMAIKLVSKDSEIQSLKEEVERLLWKSQQLNDGDIF